MKQYHDLLVHILSRGVHKTDRTGTGTKSVFGWQSRYNLNEGFPLVTTKKLHLRSIIHELLWFLKGDTNATYLQKNGVRIWDEWAAPEDVSTQVSMNGREMSDLLWDHTGIRLGPFDPTLQDRMDEHGLRKTKTVYTKRKGDLGPVYGKQWRSWEGANGQTHDQIKNVIERLKTNPDCRRLIVSAWNVGDLGEMALMPCHALFQFNTQPIGVIKRANLYAKDPANKFRLTEMANAIADWEKNRDQFMLKLASGETDASLATLVEAKEAYCHTLLDARNVPKHYLSCQLYQRSADAFLGVPFNIASYALLTHMIAQVVNMVPDDFVHTFGDMHIYSNHHAQVKELLSRQCRPLPTLWLNPEIKNIDDFTIDDIKITGYDPHPAIKAAVAV